MDILFWVGLGGFIGGIIGWVYRSAQFDDILRENGLHMLGRKIIKVRWDWRDRP